MFYRIYLFLLLILFSSCSFAKNIALYEQPKSDAKVVGNVDSDTGIIPIFTSKDGIWVKVGDPRNGNTGWIKNSDLSGVDGNFTFSQHIISTGKGPGTYQVLQFGSQPNQMSSDQAKAYLKQMEVRQQQIQQDTQRMMKDIFKNGQELNFPMIMPVIVVPATTEMKAAPKASSVPIVPATKK